MIINTFFTPMTPEETTLLDEAVKKWDNPMGFNHEQKVKDVFSRLMHGKVVNDMIGTKFSEGIVLHDPSHSKPIFYTLLRGSGGWMCRSIGLEVECTIEYCASPHCAFRQYLTELSAIERNQMAVEQGGGFVFKQDN